MLVAGLHSCYVYVPVTHGYVCWLRLPHVGLHGYVSDTTFYVYAFGLRYICWLHLRLVYVVGHGLRCTLLVTLRLNARLRLRLRFITHTFTVDYSYPARWVAFTRFTRLRLILRRLFGSFDLIAFALILRIYGCLICCVCYALPVAAVPARLPRLHTRTHTHVYAHITLIFAVGHAFAGWLFTFAFTVATAQLITLRTLRILVWLRFAVGCLLHGWLVAVTFGSRLIWITHAVLLYGWLHVTHPGCPFTFTPRTHPHYGCCYVYPLYVWVITFGLV